MAGIFGILDFSHPEIGHTESVHFEDIDSMEKYLMESLASGFDPDLVKGYVPDQKSAWRLQAAAEDVTGRRPLMYDINGRPDAAAAQTDKAEQTC